jgi:hypothetical protein
MCGVDERITTTLAGPVKSMHWGSRVASRQCDPVCCGQIEVRRSLFDAGFTVNSNPGQCSKVYVRARPPLAWLVLVTTASRQQPAPPAQQQQWIA